MAINLDVMRVRQAHTVKGGHRYLKSSIAPREVMNRR